MGYFVQQEACSIDFAESPFGEVTTSSGTLASDNPFRFSSKYFDAETGLGYWGYRWYDAGKGRWLSRDVIEEQGGVNLYGYVLNNPLGLFDIIGLCVNSREEDADSCVCGPNVTKWFFQDLAEHMAFARQNVDRWGFSFWRFRDQAKYDMHYKWMDFKVDGCGTGKCRNTVMIAGVCVRKNQLGNIAFMAVGTVYPPGWYSHQDVAETGYNLNEGKHPAGHPYASNYGSYAGKLRTDNLVSFAVGHSIGNLWAKVGNVEDFIAALGRALDDRQAMNIYAKFYTQHGGESGKELTADDLTFVPEYGGFNTKVCRPCQMAPGAPDWDGPTSFDVRKAHDKEYDTYKATKGGRAVDIDLWLQLRFEDYTK